MPAPTLAPHVFQPAQEEGLPTLLLLHGTGGSEHDLLPLGQTMCPGAALLSVRGRVLEHGMPRFFRRLQEGVFDLDDVRLRAAELARFIADASAMYEFAADDVVAVGYSNGANMAHVMMLLHPGVLSGAALLHPQLVLTPDPLPTLDDTAVFISAGERDPIVRVADVEAVIDVLTRAGARLSTHWLPDGHSLSREEIDLARQWLAAR